MYERMIPVPLGILRAANTYNVVGSTCIISFNSHTSTNLNPTLELRVLRFKEEPDEDHIVTWLQSQGLNSSFWLTPSVHSTVLMLTSLAVPVKYEDLIRALQILIMGTFSHKNSTRKPMKANPVNKQEVNKQMQYHRISNIVKMQN